MPRMAHQVHIMNNVFKRGLFYLIKGIDLRKNIDLEGDMFPLIEWIACEKKPDYMRDLCDVIGPKRVFELCLRAREKRNMYADYRRQKVRGDNTDQIFDFLSHQSWMQPYVLTSEEKVELAAESFLTSGIPNVRAFKFFWETMKADSTGIYERYPRDWQRFSLREYIPHVMRYDTEYFYEHLLYPDWKFSYGGCMSLLSWALIMRKYHEELLHDQT